MKLLKFILFASLMLAPLGAAAQQSQSDDKVTISKSQLTKDQLADLDKQALDQKISQYGKWVGVGHEIGTAVNESLSAVTTNAATFSQTDVGKMTIALVIFKVAGKELIALAVGLVFLITFVPLWSWSFYKNCVTRRILLEDNKQTGKRWELINDPADKTTEVDGNRGIHALFLVLIMLIICAQIFGCSS